jgi:hypothetical protein
MGGRRQWGLLGIQANDEGQEHIKFILGVRFGSVGTGPDRGRVKAEEGTRERLKEGFDRFEGWAAGMLWCVYDRKGGRQAMIPSGSHGDDLFCVYGYPCY